MSRHDLFTSVHKAIRAVLFDTATLVGRTDFADDDDTARAVQTVHTLLQLLDEHAGREDAVILPALAERAPAMFAELQAEHGRLAGLQRDLQQCCARLHDAELVERIALGDRLHHRCHRLVAAQLVHLEREDVEVNRVLWAHWTDPELQAMHTRLRSSLPPARAQEWLRRILVSTSPGERRLVLAGLQSSMPAPVFATMTAPARQALGEAAWTAALAAAPVRVEGRR